MRVLDPGHRYALQTFDKQETEIVFIKRSGGAVQYNDDHDGLQSQEVLRALIDRTKFLNAQIPCNESENAIWNLRMALFEYEARAWRRKQAAINREKGQHYDEARPRLHRGLIYDDVPFSEHLIEERPIGEDGHVVFPYFEWDYDNQRGV